jgi:hypothetical protein
VLFQADYEIINHHIHTKYSKAKSALNNISIRNQ